MTTTNVRYYQQINFPDGVPVFSEYQFDCHASQPITASTHYSENGLTDSENPPAAGRNLLIFRTMGMCKPKASTNPADLYRKNRERKKGKSLLHLMSRKTSYFSLPSSPSRKTDIISPFYFWNRQQVSPRRNKFISASKLLYRALTGKKKKKNARFHVPPWTEAHTLKLSGKRKIKSQRLSSSSRAENLNELALKSETSKL